MGAVKLKELPKRTTFVRTTKQLNEVYGKKSINKTDWSAAPRARAAIREMLRMGLGCHAWPQSLRILLWKSPLLTQIIVIGFMIIVCWPGFSHRAFLWHDEARMTERLCDCAYWPGLFCRLPAQQMVVLRTTKCSTMSVIIVVTIVVLKRFGIISSWFTLIKYWLLVLHYCSDSLQLFYFSLIFEAIKYKYDFSEIKIIFITWLLKRLGFK